MSCSNPHRLDLNTHPSISLGARQALQLFTVTAYLFLPCLGTDPPKPLQWFQSKWHIPQKVVYISYMDSHLKNILEFVPSTLKPQ